VCDCVSDLLRRLLSVTLAAASRLVAAAQEADASDNITVIVVFLRKTIAAPSADCAIIADQRLPSSLRSSSSSPLTSSSSSDDESPASSPPGLATAAVAGGGHLPADLISSLVVAASVGPADVASRSGVGIDHKRKRRQLYVSMVQCEPTQEDKGNGVDASSAGDCRT